MSPYDLPEKARSQTDETQHLRLIRGRPNPNGTAAELFLVEGQSAHGPVSEIVPAPGVALPARRTDLQGRAFRLKVLHINDLHGHVVRFQSEPALPVFSRIARYIQESRARCEESDRTAVVALSAGDDLVGTVLDELLGEDPESYVLHAGYRIYAAAGIDASTIGNHDLDMGSQLLARAIEADARHPILSANLVGSRWLEGLYHPAALLVVKGVRIGLIGLSPPGARLTFEDLGLEVVDPVRAVRNLLPAFRPLCDIVIILSHLGYSLESSSAGVSVVGDVELAQSLAPGAVHLIVGGHTHHVLNEQGLTADNIVNGIPIVQAGTLGNFIGEAHITLHERGAALTNARLHPTALLPDDEAFETEVVQPILELAAPFLQQDIGAVADHWDLTTEAVRNEFASHESALANFITDALVARVRAHHYEVDLAAIDDSCVRCGLSGDRLTFADWFRLMPFPDTVRLCWLSGQELEELLHDNARRADRPDEPHTNRGFLQFSAGLRYAIDLGARRDQARARNILVGGRPLAQQLDRTFLVACTSFTRASARSWERVAREIAGMPLLDLGQVRYKDTRLFLRDEIVAFIRDNDGITEPSGLRRDGRLVFV